MSIVNAIAGFVCGVLSGCGIGGGSLLLIYMTQLGGLEQAVAQGVNLIYFLPTSSAALVSHAKNRLIDGKLVLKTALPGMATAALSAFFAASIDSGNLRRLFGIFCVIVGAKMFISK